MSRKQGIIHLGRSKSPARFQRDPLSSRHNRVQSIRTSRTKQPMQQASILNYSMHVTSPQNGIKLDQENYANTHCGFFPPNPQSVQQTVNLKENVRSPERVAIIQQSPSKRVIVTRQIDNSPCKVSQSSGQFTQRQAQLQRRIKVLQSRIQQLHQQKQNCVVKAHEENKRICHDNSILQARLAEMQGLKNKQVFGLRQQLSNLRNSAQRTEQVQKTQKPLILRNNMGTEEHQFVESSPKSHSALRNAAYVDDQDDKISINNHTYKVDQHTPQFPKNTKSSFQVEAQCRLLMEKVKQLEGENNTLRDQLSEMKDTILKTTSVIESNNKKIVQNYENRISSLLNELQGCKGQIGQTLQLKESLSFSQNQTEMYVSDLLKKSQQLNSMEKQLQNTKKALQTSKKETQQHVQTILKHTMLINDQQKQLEDAKESIDYKSQQIEEYVSSLLLKEQELMRQEQEFKTKIFELETQCHTAEQKLHEQQILDKKPVQSCQKCKQLVRTLIKLNQKTFSKTS